MPLTHYAIETNTPVANVYNSVFYCAIGPHSTLLNVLPDDTLIPATNSPDITNTLVALW